MSEDNQSSANDGTRRDSATGFTYSGTRHSGTGFIFEDASRSSGPVEPEIDRLPSPDGTPPNAASGNTPGSPSSRCEANPSLTILQPQPLEGVVTLVERTEEEQLTNWYRFFSKTILAIVFLPILFILGFASLILAIAFAIIGFAALSSLFNPVTWMTALFELLEVIVLGRLQRNNQQTVYRGLVRDAEDRVFAFYLHGALRTGLLVEGHHVRLFGDWRLENRRNTNERGTLFVCQGQDLTTGSTLSSARNAWRPVFFILMALFIVLVGVCVIKLPQFFQETSALFHSMSK